MSILYTVTAYAPSVGGAQLHLHEFVKRVHQAHDVGVIYHWNTHRTDWLEGTTIAAPTYAPPLSPEIFDGVPTFPMWMSHEQRRQVRVWVRLYWLLQGIVIDHIAALLLNNMEYAITRLFAAPPRLVHNSRIGRESLTVASLRYARARGIPFVFTPNHHAHWRGWFYRRYADVIRQADALIVHTPYEADELTRFGVHADRIEVIGVGPILSAPEASGERAAADFRARYNIPPDAPLVLFLGQKYLYKRFDVILKAMPDVWKLHPATRFVFIGPRTDDSRRIFAAINDPRVIELDIVDTREKTAALAACTLLCMPSHRESFGGVYLEAWMLNKPVIGGDAPAIRSLITDGVNGCLVDADPAKLTHRLRDLLSDADMRAEMGAAGRAVAERYRWESLSDCLLSVYNRLM